MLEVSHLQKSYRQAEREIMVLKDVNLSIPESGSFAVVGSSGVGKSTLLNCLGLLDSFQGGEISLQNQNFSELTASERTRARQQNVGFVFQFHYLMSELSALENVMLPLRVDKVEKEEATERAVEWLGRVGLHERLSHLPTELSGGEQQRVAIARALVRHPKMILADEPTGNLDTKTAALVFELLCERCEELKAVLLMATHNMELASRLDAVKTLKEGILV